MKEDVSIVCDDSFVKQIFRSRSFWTFSIIFSALMILYTTKDSSAMRAAPTIFIIEVIVVMVIVFVIKFIYLLMSQTFSKSNKGGKQ